MKAATDWYLNGQPGAQMNAYSISVGTINQFWHLTSNETFREIYQNETKNNNENRRNNNDNNINTTAYKNLWSNEIVDCMSEEKTSKFWEFKQCHTFTSYLHVLAKTSLYVATNESSEDLNYQNIMVDSDTGISTFIQALTEKRDRQAGKNLARIVCNNADSKINFHVFAGQYHVWKGVVKTSFKTEMNRIKHSKHCQNIEWEDIIEISAGSLYDLGYNYNYGAY